MTDAVPMIEELSVWSTSIFTVLNPDHEALKEALLAYVYAYREQQQQAIASEVAPTAKHQLFESRLDLLDDLDPTLQSLRATLESLVSEVATALNQPYWPEGAEGQAIITESWCHITTNGGYHDAHSHPNCSWCGIYYVDVGESDLSQRNGVNRFYDPRHCADHYLDAGSQYLNGTGVWDFEPLEGQIIIFPSYLKHSALPYFGNKDRVVIAFNTMIELLG